MGITIAVSRIFELIYLLLFIYILLSWFPSVKWHNEPFRSLRGFADLFFAPFRRVIPPIGMIDISPIIAFICLGILRNIVVNLLASFGL